MDTYARNCCLLDCITKATSSETVQRNLFFIYTNKPSAFVAYFSIQHNAIRCCCYWVPLFCPVLFFHLVGACRTEPVDYILRVLNRYQLKYNNNTIIQYLYLTISVRGLDVLLSSAAFQSARHIPCPINRKIFTAQSHEVVRHFLGQGGSFVQQYICRE